MNHSFEELVKSAHANNIHEHKIINSVKTITKTAANLTPKKLEEIATYLIARELLPQIVLFMLLDNDYIKKSSIGLIKILFEIFSTSDTHVDLILSTGFIELAIARIKSRNLETTNEVG
jgi:hypothetical protein